MDGECTRLWRFSPSKILMTLFTLEHGLSQFLIIHKGLAHTSTLELLSASAFRDGGHLGFPCSSPSFP